MPDMPDRSSATGAHGAALARAIGLRQILPLAVLAAIFWAMWDRLGALDPARIGAALASVTPDQWAIGAIFTGVSFWAVGRYDAVAHRLADSPVPARAAVTSGAAAIAVAQTLGMGTLTGALARWRLLPALTLWQAMRLSLFVSLSFLAGWALLASFAALALPLPGGLALALTVWAGAAALVALSLLRPRFARHLPPLRAMAAILGLTALDTLAAGTVLWALIPADLAVPPGPVLAAYLLALGAGLVLTTPGGVGPFELALLALLPDLPEEPLLAAVIAYRVLYYALPALIGGVLLLRGPGAALAPAPPLRAPRIDRRASAPQLPFLVDAMIARAPRAEAALLRHGRLGLLTDAAGRPTALAAETGQALVLVCDPLRREADPAAVIALAEQAARRRFRAPVLYKAGARLAAAARARGWVVLPVAQEAWLDPRGFTPDGPARRQLRRKLRAAEAAAVTIRIPGPAAPLPLAEMDRIAARWARAHGGERGFSMGTWRADTLPWAQVLLAHDSTGKLVAFLTLHANENEQAIDLMRSAPDAPEGTMQALVTAAIAAAGAAGLPRFSLAAVPLAADPGDGPALRRLRGQLARRSGSAGLRQFKAAFAPHWEPLYAAAPSRRALVLGALDLAREIAPAGRRRS
ncbi:phosphatidylglycerol lysyltransferase domain-containing protein [Sinisalibacter aestuarii]|uniref:Phosphatidylglycerol lysyltransferase C-terminal domain-containing protein n=1 Tax=Sinisalibacter aestuarii TaxID=2949426 RepID=A0ABQ5LUH0_9RHOB|nr:phosphatidylglycerol lysyltransferase domain-containing protein [Sinisalibacter aestuarii]GKY87996.1 hypothetical protein STA1M1_18650 [Sinisalibacter aestuarii]